MKISAVVLTKNEEKNIVECIATLSFCDEVLLIDDNSSDETKNIAEKFGAKVFTRSLNNDFASQRNFGLQKVKEEWVLFIDADERVSKELSEEIKKAIENKDFDGFYLRRKDKFLGKNLKYGETGSVRLLRLARKDKGRRWKRKVHEVWEIDGKVGKLKNSIIHNPHPTLWEFIEEVDWMSTLHAKENLKEGKRSSLIKIILLPILKFINNFVFKLGILDGVRGFISAVIMSFHSFLAWGKLWLTQKKKG